MYCGKCGKEANPGDRYCSACGARLGAEGTAVNKKKTLWNLLTVLIIAAVLVIGGFHMFRGEPENPPTEVQRPTAEETHPTLAATEPTQSQTQPAATEAPQMTQLQTQVSSSPAEKLYLAKETRSEMGMEILIQYRYDWKGRLVRKDTGDGYTRSYSYRDDGTLEKEGVFFDGEPYMVILYDTYGMPETESDLQGGTVTYDNTYDTQNRLLTSLKSNQDGSPAEKWLYAYDHDGGYTLDYTDYDEYGIHCRKHTVYDPEGRLVRQEQDLESGMTVEYRTEHTYDAAGNLLRTEYAADTGDFQEKRTTEYVHTCDASGKVTQTEVYVTSSLEGGTRTLERTVTYAYDSAGNRIRQDNRGGDGSWAYPYTWEYDAQGNLVKYTEGTNELVQTYIYLPLEEVQ